MNWTDEQLDIFDWFSQGDGNALVVARAGTGKTATTIEGASRANQRLVLVTAFNKTAAQELQSKAPDGIQARTLHSLGFGWCQRSMAGIKTNFQLGRKVVKEAWTRLRESDKAFPSGTLDLMRKVEKIVALVKGTQPFFTQKAEITAVMRSFNLGPTSFESEEFGVLDDHLVEVAWSALVLTLEEFKGEINFDDMIWMPLRKQWCQGVFDLICVDEAQDMSAAQIELALRSVKKTGRICVIGDDKQAIYQFRGADPGVLDRLGRRLDAEVFSLTTTFRCPQAVVKSVNYLVPDYTAAPGAPMGYVGNRDAPSMIQYAVPGDFVLSRTNAPLISAALEFLRHGRKAQIVGAEDFGEAIRKTFHGIWSSMEDQEIDAFFIALDEWHHTSEEKADTDGQRDYINDLYAAIRILTETARDGDPADFAFEVGVRIEEIFGKGSPDAIELSTIHKAKGKEADQVWLIAKSFPDRTHPICIHCGKWEWMHGHKDYGSLCPVGYAPNLDWVVAEENIEYVAATRAKKSLFWVGR